jgi:hypothetical protein
MIGLLCFVLVVLDLPFKSKLRLEAENAVLRHQLNVVRRRLHGRVRPTNNDRWFFIQLYCWFPSILQVLTIIRAETLVRWHRAGFRSYWRWKSRAQGGADGRRKSALRRVRHPRRTAQARVGSRAVERRQIHGQTTGAPSQGWRTFLRNHAPDIAANLANSVTC